MEILIAIIVGIIVVSVLRGLFDREENANYDFLKELSKGFEKKRHG